MCKQKLRKNSRLAFRVPGWQRFGTPMNAVRLPFLLLPLLFLFFLPQSLRAAEEPQEILRALPKTIAACEQGDLKDYGGDLGSSIAYRKEGLLFTVYVYDLGHPKIGEALTDPVLKEAFESARKELTAAAAQGYYEDLKERDAGRAEFGKEHETLRARYHLTQAMGKAAGTKSLSEIHVFGARGQIIKLRITGTMEKAGEHEKAIAQFIPKLMELLRQPAAPKKPNLEL